MALRLGPDIGQAGLGNKQLVFAIGGLACLCADGLGDPRSRWIRNFKYTWAAVGLVLVGITLLHAHSFSTNAPSRDVLTIGSGGLSFQPSEILKICLVIFFAGLSQRESRNAGRLLLRIGPFRLPPLKHLGPLVLMLGLALLDHPRCQGAGTGDLDLRPLPGDALRGERPAILYRRFGSSRLRHRGCGDLSTSFLYASSAWPSSAMPSRRLAGRCCSRRWLSNRSGPDRLR